MNGRSARWRMLAWAGAMALMAACGRKDKASEAVIAADTTQDRRGIDSARMDMERTVAGAPTALAGTTWTLVGIRHPAGQRHQAGAGGGVHRRVRQRRPGERGGRLQPGKRLLHGDPSQGSHLRPPRHDPGGCAPRDRYRRASWVISRRCAATRSWAMRCSSAWRTTVSTSLPRRGRGGHRAAERRGDLQVHRLHRSEEPAGCHLQRRQREEGDATHAGKNIVARQVRSGSGARYEGAGVTFWNKGRDAAVTWLGRNLNCVVTIQ